MKWGDFTCRILDSVVSMDLSFKTRIPPETAPAAMPDSSDYAPPPPSSARQPAKPMTLLTWVIPQRTVDPLPHEVIDRGQKGGERLAGSGRRRDQQMAAALDRRPSLRLCASGDATNTNGQQRPAV